VLATNCTPVRVFCSNVTKPPLKIKTSLEIIDRIFPFTKCRADQLKTMCPTSSKNESQYDKTVHHHAPNPSCVLPTPSSTRVPPRDAPTHLCLLCACVCNRSALKKTYASPERDHCHIESRLRESYFCMLKPSRACAYDITRTFAPATVE